MSTITAIRERPILFSAPMVRAIIDGRKTQTRRAVKPQPPGNADEVFAWYAPELPAEVKAEEGCWYWIGDKIRFHERCPYGGIGDVLWVRESWCEANDQYGAPHIIFMAGGDSYLRGWTEERGDFLICDSSDPDVYQLDEGPKRASIHLPKHWARLWLEITDVRVERLNDISGADAIAEGLLEWTDPPRITTKHYGAGIPDVWEDDPRKAFARIWDSINGKTHPWKSNCWVWVVSFKKLDGRPS